MRCLLVLCAVVAMASAIGEAGRYDPGRYDPGRYDQKKYDAGRYDPGRYDPSKYDQSGRWTPDTSGQYNGDRGDRGNAGGQYDGGYGDNGDRGPAGGFYVPENQPQVLETLPPAPIPIYTITPKPKEHPINNYQYKYALGDAEKSLLLTLNLEGDSDDLNKAFFEYTNSKNQVYRTDYIADAAHADHVL